MWDVIWRYWTCFCTHILCIY